MARRTRSLPMVPKLGIIVEEEYDEVEISLHPPRGRPSVRQPAKLETPARTVTIRKYQQTTTNVPQFLHAGMWPTPGKFIESQCVVTGPANKTCCEETCIICVKAEYNDVEVVSTDDFGYDLFKIVSVDQLSMVVDYWSPDADDDVHPLWLDSPTTTPANELAGQRGPFFREIMNEHWTRRQTIQHLEELEDSDSIIEVVATLEGYRQNGWAEEMLKAFPHECWLLWSSSGLGTVLPIDDAHNCDEGGSSDFDSGSDDLESD